MELQLEAEKMLNQKANQANMKLEKDIYHHALRQEQLNQEIEDRNTKIRLHERTIKQRD